MCLKSTQSFLKAFNKLPGELSSKKNLMCWNKKFNRALKHVIIKKFKKAILDHK